MHQISNLHPQLLNTNQIENDSNNNVNEKTSKTQILIKNAQHVIRSSSIGSQHSSGRGGSSAMSSAEGLGNANLAIKPILSTMPVEYTMVYALNELENRPFNSSKFDYTFNNDKKNKY